MGKKRVVACGFRVKLRRKNALFLRKSGCFWMGNRAFWGEKKGRLEWRVVQQIALKRGEKACGIIENLHC